MFSSQLVNLATFDRSQMNKYVEQAILKDIGIDTITARVMGDTVILDGVVYKAEDLKRAEQLAKLRVPSVVDLIVVQDVMIETDLMFVDIKISKSLDWGNNVLDSVSVNANLNASGNSLVAGLPFTYGVSATAASRIVADVGNGNAKSLPSRTSAPRAARREISRTARRPISNNPARLAVPHRWSPCRTGSS